MSDELDRLAPAEEHDLKAAEYVLGLLAPPEARAVEALALNEATMASSIQAWETRLAPLVALVEPVAPSPFLWRRLALATGIDNGLQAASQSRSGALRRAGPWQAATAAALALAAALGFLLLTKPAIGPAPLIAALSPYGGPGATFLVRMAADGTATVVAVGDTTVPAGRALQLWAKTDDGPPISLGLLPPSGRTELRLPVSQGPTVQGPAQSGTQLLISQEPAGGSPQAGPTGPLVYAGKLTGI